MYGKLSELRLLVEAKNIDIICVTESHFSDELQPAEIDIPGFNVFLGNRNFKLDRTKSNSGNISEKGGSVIYIRDYIPIVENSHDKSLDSTSVIIETDIGKILLGCIYRSVSLNGSQNDDFLEYFNSKAAIPDNGDIETLIVGDFNSPEISWLSGSVAGPADSINKAIVLQKDILEIVHNNGLSWLITDEITRRRRVGNIIQESTIDQIFCSNDSLISEFEICQPLGKSDHVSIIVDLNLFEAENKRCYDIDDTKRNWGGITEMELLELSNPIDWNFAHNPEDMTVEEMWEEIHGKLLTVTECVPEVGPDKPGKIDNYNMPWVNSSLKRAVRAKNKAWAVFDSIPSIKNLDIALNKQGNLDNIETKAKIKYEKHITNDLKHNSKAFYSYLRNRRKVKSIVTVLRRDDQTGSMTKNDFETAECFADAFSSVFVQEPMGPLPQDCYKTDMNINVSGSNDLFNVSEKDVFDELRHLNIFKSFGPDNVHPKLLYALAGNPGFIKCLSVLYNKCIQEQKIPSIWKLANVVALHKKDSKLDPLNYRPVSLTCILCKIYEKFLRRHILNIVNSSIIDNQHGFVENKSCFSNLLETVDSVIEMLEAGYPVDIFYFDFWKAFDSVPHYRLLTKLDNYGISGPILNIIRDFLSGRTLRTSVRGCYSTIRAVLSGVPQGSVLGPLLFVLFINDLPDKMKNITKLFADDLKLIVNAKNRAEVNQDIASLEKWESLWLLCFNPKKCKVMHLEYNNNPMNHYFLDGVLLEDVTSEKDLGLVMSKNLGWNEAIRACIKETNKFIGWISRNLMNRDPKVLSRVYKSIIRPRLEYCVQLWNPAACHGNWSLILELESIQRRFTRLAKDIGPLPYSRRLETMGLTTLGERRLRGDLIETFKMVTGKVEYGKDIFKLSRSGSNIVSKINNSSNIANSINRLRKSFLPERIRNYYNNLPAYVKSSDSVLDFKVNLETFKRESSDHNVNNFWEISNIIIDKIEGNPNYLTRKDKFNAYLLENPFVAKKKGINIF